MSYVLPIFKALLNQNKENCIRVYEKVKSGYHSIAKTQIENMIKWKMNDESNKLVISNELRRIEVLLSGNLVIIIVVGWYGSITTLTKCPYIENLVEVRQYLQE